MESVSLPESLNSFYNTFNGKIDSLISSNSELGSTLGTIKNGYVNVASGVKSAWTDQHGNVSVNNINLISSAVQRLEESSKSDFSSFLNEMKSTVNDVEEIKEKINGVNSIIVDDIKDKSNKQKKELEKQNSIGELQVMIRNAEGKIKALKDGMNGVSLGIKGNMVTGGSLGSKTNFVFNFTKEEWNPNYYRSYGEELPIEGGGSSVSTVNGGGGILQFLKSCGCFVAGLVESPLKLVGGLVDAGAILIADVVSLFGGDASGIKEFVKKEYVKGFFDRFIPENSVARSIGNFTGEVITGAAAILTGPVSLGIYSAANAGRISSGVLKSTDNLVLSTGAGITSGVLSYLLLGKAKAPVEKVANAVSKIPSLVKPKISAITAKVGSGVKTIATKTAKNVPKVGLGFGSGLVASQLLPSGNKE